MRFLMIEDQKLNLDPLETLVCASELSPKAKVTRTRDLNHAISALQHQSFEMIFIGAGHLEANLAGGLKTLRESSGEAPIVIVTDKNIEDFGQEAIRWEADDFIDRSDFNLKMVRRIMRYAKVSFQASQSARAKSAFLANMSHEIRTPLNLIIGTADILAETQLTQQQRRLISTFTNAGNHLLTLLSDVLDLSQIEGQGLRCLKNTFDLNEVFFESCNLVGVLCRSKKLKFDYLLGQGIPSACRGDKVRIRQVMLNLLNNAVKFTKRGKIELRLEVLERQDNEVAVRFIVRDTGIGMDKKALDHAYSYFYQREAGLERTYRGGGLGLSLVKAIAEHYHGSTEIISADGEGTEVRVTLRLELEPATMVSPQMHLQNKKIHLVTYGELEAQSIRHQLQRLGARVTHNTSGELALQRLANEPDYDYLLLDVQTSDIGGLDLLGRHDFTFPRENVIMLLPPLHRQRDVEDCSQLGVTRSLYKPFSVTRFLELTGHLQPIEKIKSGPASFSPLEILVVDDDLDNRELVAAYLAKTPHRVTYAKDGQEAINLSKDRSFDLIMMDIEMPGLNGYETAKRIKEQELGQFSKILGVSANAFPENITEAKQAGFSGYLTKPIRKERLLNSIMECASSEQFLEVAPSTAYERT
ncbi:MAG: response regulator [Bdellovibrionales bacterium]